MKEAKRLRTTRLFGREQLGTAASLHGVSLSIGQRLPVRSSSKSLLNTGQPKQTERPLLMPTVEIASAHLSTLAMVASSEGWQSSQSGGACGKTWAICLPQAKGALIETLIVYRAFCLAQKGAQCFSVECRNAENASAINQSPYVPCP